MNFRKAKTSEKLRWLAEQLLRPKLQKIFDQSDCDNCVDGLGLRLTGQGILRSTSFAEETSGGNFEKRYGVSFDESIALLTAKYSRLQIRAKDKDYSQVTPDFAATILNRLADKYERKGK